MAAPEALSVRGAVRRYGRDAGLFGLDLTVAAGEVHALVGLNGAGKTTLLRAVLGMVGLDAGEIRIGGTPLDGGRRVRWSEVGHDVDGPFAYPELTVVANLTAAGRLRRLTGGALASAVDAVIADMGLERYRDVTAGRLSQGNRQRLGLAAALVHDPRLIVLDEPTNALDPAGVITLRESLRTRAEAGSGILVSSHHPRAAPVFRATTVILLLGIALLAGSLFGAATSGNAQILAQLGPLADAAGWPLLTGVAGQITAAGGLLGCGVALSWTFGREFADRTIAGHFALPIRRSTIATAKLLVYVAWAVLVGVLLTVLVLVGGLALGLGVPEPDAAARILRLLLLSALTGLIATPAALAATWGRGVLPGVATTVALLAVAQIAVIASPEAASWLPFTAPALWALDLAPVGALQLTGPIVLAAACALIAGISWDRLRVA